MFININTHININNTNIDIKYPPSSFSLENPNTASVIDWKLFVPVPYSYLFLPEKRTKFKAIIYLNYVILQNRWFQAAQRIKYNRL